MDTFFIEKIEDDTYKIALIDKHRIFEATEPGLLSTVFECSLNNPTRDDDAQIFYALAPMINADDSLCDIITSHRSRKLNSWTISVETPNSDNIFTALSPLTRDQRIKLYNTKYSITPEKEITSNSNSLFSLVPLSQQLEWKSGILQRCIDRLVKLEFRGNSHVYALIDEEYRRLVRFKLETESSGKDFLNTRIFVLFIQRLISDLGLKNSRDTTPFIITPDKSSNIEKILKCLNGLFPESLFTGSITEQISNVLLLWCGSKLIKMDDEEKYQLQLDENITEGLNYLQPWLPKPKVLDIIETPM